MKNKNNAKLYIGIIVFTIAMVYMGVSRNNRLLGDGNARYTTGKMLYSYQSKRGRKCVYEFEYEGRLYQGFTRSVDSDKCIPGDSIRILFSAIEPGYNFHDDLIR